MSVPGYIFLCVFFGVIAFFVGIPLTDPWGCVISVILIITGASILHAINKLKS